MILKELVLLGGSRNLSPWKRPLRSLSWGFRSAGRSWVGKPTPVTEAESGGGRTCLGFEGPSPLPAAWGRGVTASSPRRHRCCRCGCNKRSPRRLPPPCPEGAAVRGGQYPSFLPPHVGTCGCWEPSWLALRFVRSRLPWHQVGGRQVGLEGQRGAPPLACLRPWRED